MLEMAHSQETNQDEMIIINECWTGGDSQPGKMCVLDPRLSVYGTIRAKQVKETNNIELVVHPGPPDPTDSSCKLQKCCDYEPCS